MTRRVLFLVFLGVGGALLVRTFLFEAVSVASPSMEPTLFVRTHYLVNRLVYRLHPPRRGDIVVFRSPLNPRVGLIKRVIALPGDTVEIRRKKVLLNDRPLEEPYVIYKRPNDRLVGDNLGPLVVPPDSLFVLGDNRDESEDSSVWKDPKTGERVHFVPMANLKGRLVRIP